MTVQSLAILRARAFTAFFEEDRFFSEWKVARLVLLKKSNKPDLSLFLCRPIYLLSETGKLFEKILYCRLQWHLDLVDRIADNQFGFHTGRSY